MREGGVTPPAPPLSKVSFRSFSLRRRERFSLHLRYFLNNMAICTVSIPNIEAIIHSLIHYLKLIFLDGAELELLLSFFSL